MKEENYLFFFFFFLIINCHLSGERLKVSFNSFKKPCYFKLKKNQKEKRGKIEKSTEF